MSDFNQLVTKVLKERTPEELARGFLRYEVYRRRNQMEIKTIFQRNLAGERFDKIVDEFVLMDFNQ